MKKYSFRKLFNDLHLWLGIASGLVLFVVCLSGTIYTFRSEIEALLEPEKYRLTAAEGAAPLTPEALMAKLSAEVGGKVVFMEIPHEADRPYQLSIKKSEQERRGTAYYVNPYTGEVLGTSGGATADFFGGVFKLHRWLLLDPEVGRPVVGAATLIFVFLILSGLVLWWPKKLKQWKQGLVVKTSGNWKRLNHDLHNTLGFYAFLLLLLMALTGLCWSFDWYRSGLSTVLGTEVFGRGGKGGRNSNEKEAAPLAAEAKPLSYTQLLALASQQLPYEGDYRLQPADTATGVVALQKHKTGFFALAASDKIELNLYTGKVMQLERFSDKAFNEQIAASIKPLHTGEIFGTFSKILYFLASLIGTSLPITGTLIWINKLKKKAGRKGTPRAVAALP